MQESLNLKAKHKYPLFLLFIFFIINYALLHFGYNFDEESIVALSLFSFFLLFVIIRLDFMASNYFYNIWYIFLMFRYIISANIIILNYFYNASMLVLSSYLLIGFVNIVILVNEWTLFLSNNKLFDLSSIVAFMSNYVSFDFGAKINSLLFINISLELLHNITYSIFSINKFQLSNFDNYNYFTSFKIFQSLK